MCSCGLIAHNRYHSPYPPISHYWYLFIAQPQQSRRLSQNAIDCLLFSSPLLLSSFFFLLLSSPHLPLLVPIRRDPQTAPQRGPERAPRAAPVRQLFLSQTEGTPEAPVWLGCLECPTQKVRLRLPRTACNQPEKCPRKCPSLLGAWVKPKGKIETQGILPPQPSSFFECLLGAVRP